MRAWAGFVRRCHGDLHLRNIVMIDGVPTPFDALEFDERLATTDILYDFAFLIMDLLHLNLRREANVVFNRYVYYSWRLIQNYGFQIFPLFLAIRAAIRSMVSAQASLRDKKLAEEHRTESEFYLLEATRYLEPVKPKMVVISGLSGTGKSTLAAELAPEIGRFPGALLLRSDLERKKMLEAEEFAHLPADAYSAVANRHVYERIFDKARIALEQGQAVVLDAVFADVSDRLLASELADKLDIPFCGLWLSAPEKTLIDRVATRGRDASDADVAVVQGQIARFADLNLAHEEGWQQVDASGTPEQTLDKARFSISNPPQSPV